MAVNTYVDWVLRQWGEWVRGSDFGLGYAPPPSVIRKGGAGVTCDDDTMCRVDSVIAGLYRGDKQIIKKVYLRKDYENLNEAAVKHAQREFMLRFENNEKVLQPGW